MNVTNSVVIQQIRDDLVPALNVLWAIKVRVQGHHCYYQEKLLPAIDGIIRARSWLGLTAEQCAKLESLAEAEAELEGGV